MEKSSVAAIVGALNEAHINYLIVGGLAVVAHGYVRFTADMDVILDFREDNLRPALAALAGLGYRPMVPVPLEQFADASIRAQWIREKGLTVFSLISPDHPTTTVDLFVEAPLPFDQAYASAVRQEVVPQVSGTFISYDDLLALKKQAGRPKDLEDIKRLQEIREPPPNE
jgi:hypothetical protein